MQEVGSCYCPICQRQVATTVVSIRLPQTAARILVGLAVFSIGMVLLVVLIGFVIAPYGLSIISNPPTRQAHRCDFCGTIIA